MITKTAIAAAIVGSIATAGAGPASADTSTPHGSASTTAVASARWVTAQIGPAGANLRWDASINAPIRMWLRGYHQVLIVCRRFVAPEGKTWVVTKNVLGGNEVGWVRSDMMRQVEPYNLPRC